MGAGCAKAGCAGQSLLGPAEGAVGIRRTADLVRSPASQSGVRGARPPDPQAAIRLRVTTDKTSMMVRRNVIPQPVIPVRVFAPVVRIPFVGRLLREFGTEDLVNCVAVVALVVHHMPLKL